MAFGSNSPFGLRINESVSGGGLTDKMTPYKVYTTAAGVGPTLAGSVGYLFKGDPVVFDSAGVAGAGVTSVAAGTVEPMFTILNAGAAATAVAQNVFVGIFMGCEYTDAITGITKYDTFIPNALQVKSGTSITAFVNDDPNVLFEVQYSTSTNNAEASPRSIFLNGFIGQNAKLQLGGVAFTAPVGAIPTQNPASGNISTKTSGVYVDGSSITLVNAGAGNALFDIKVVGIAYNSEPITAGTTIGVDVPFVTLLCKFNRHVYGSNGTPGPFNVA